MISNNPFPKNRDNHTVEKERTKRRETGLEEKGHENLSHAVERTLDEGSGTWAQVPRGC